MTSAGSKCKVYFMTFYCDWQHIFNSSVVPLYRDDVRTANIVVADPDGAECLCIDRE